jgi:hypothetical protein
MSSLAALSTALGPRVNGRERAAIVESALWS